MERTVIVGVIWVVWVGEVDRLGEVVGLVDDEGGSWMGVGLKGGRGGLRRLVRDLETRSWAAWGEEARTRQIIWVGGEGKVRSWWRMCAPRAPVAPVRICGG